MIARTISLGISNNSDCFLFISTSAGSDVIETNTYQASIRGFMKYLSLNEEESYNVIKDSVKLAKIACEKFKAETASKSKQFAIFEYLKQHYFFHFRWLFKVEESH